MDTSQFLQDNPDSLQALREGLKTANFTPKGVLDTLKIKDSMSIGGESNLLLLLYRTIKGTPLDWLIRLLNFGENKIEIKLKVKELL